MYYHNVHLFIFMVISINGQVTINNEVTLKDYCSMNSLPEYNMTCTTCSGQCGAMMDFRQRMFCSCDSSCITYKDCCPDFRESCPEMFKKATEIANRFHNVSINCRKYEKNLNPTNFIVSCPFKDNACNVTSSFDVVPVTDLDSGLEFVNGKCAACNGVKNGKVWETKLFCYDPISSNDILLKNDNNNATGVSTDGLLKAIETGACLLIVQQQLKSFHQIRECEMKLTNPCEQSNCKNEAIKHACQFGDTRYVHTDTWTRRNYKNIYCAMCLSPIEFTFVECGRIEVTPPGREFYPEYSLAVIFDFNPNTGGAVGIRADPDSCTNDQEWINSEIGCKYITCGPDFIFNGSICVIEWYEVKISTLIEVIFDKNTTNQFGNLFPGEVVDQSSFILTHFKVLSNNSVYIKHVKSTPEVVTDTVGFKMILNVYLKLNVFKLGETLLVNTTHILQLSLLNGLYSHAIHWFTNKTEVKSVTVSAENASDIFSFAHLNCKQVLLKADEFQLLSNRSIRLHNSVLVHEGNYIKNQSHVYVCKKDIYNNHTAEESSGINSVTGIITITFMALSEIGLLIRLILQPILPVYSTFPLKLQFNMCISMFLSFGLFLVSPLFNTEYVLCKIVAVLLHWGFLSLFCWTTVISVDIWDSFRGFGMKKRARNTSFKILCRYILVGWCVPLIWVIPSIIVDETANESSSFLPQYGINRCWMNDKYAILIFFAVPFGLFVCLNILFFILTAINLRKAFDESNKLVKQEKQMHYSLYVKLFILMGITWIAGFIAPFVDHISVWIIFILLNASQGIFIFIAFVCTKQVYDALLKLKEEHSSQESGYTTRNKNSIKTGLTVLHDSSKFDDIKMCTVNHDSPTNL